MKKIIYLIFFGLASMGLWGAEDQNILLSESGHSWTWTNPKAQQAPSEEPTKKYISTGVKVPEDAARLLAWAKAVLLNNIQARVIVDLIIGKLCSTKKLSAKILVLDDDDDENDEEESIGKVEVEQIDVVQYNLTSYQIVEFIDDLAEAIENAKTIATINRKYKNDLPNKTEVNSYDFKIALCNIFAEWLRLKQPQRRDLELFDLKVTGLQIEKRVVLAAHSAQQFLYSLF